ncbi:MAG: 50S ribosomal protein L30e [Candidatus Kariarchaeaceae archaeon]|jgi:large subunit ribosomal protein L30e
MVDLDRSISVAKKSGKTELGLNSALKAARTGEAKAIVIAANAPQESRRDLEYYAKLSNLPIIHYPKTSQDLGIVCGRPHLTAYVTIYSPGDSNILDAIES